MWSGSDAREQQGRRRGDAGFLLLFLQLLRKKAWVLFLCSTSVGVLLLSYKRFRQPMLSSISSFSPTYIFIVQKKSFKRRQKAKKIIYLIKVQFVGKLGVAKHKRSSALLSFISVSNGVFFIQQSAHATQERAAVRPN